MKKRFGFDFSNIKGDLFGGITAGIVALPLALAFGLQSGLGAAAGLYGAIFISFFAALFGGTNTQISGPTAPMTAVSMLVIAGIIAANEGDLEKALPSIIMVFLLAGLMQIALGFMKVGQYIRYIPYPVVSGFMTGIGVIILITQILPMLGYYPKEDLSFVNEFKPEAEEVILEKILREEAAEDILVLEDFKETVRRAGNITEENIMQEAAALASNEASGVIGSLRLTNRAVQNINWIDFILGLLAIIIIYGFKRITTLIPSTLVALLAVTLGAFFFIPGYRTIGDIPSGFPILRLEIFAGFSLAQISPYLISAISLALLGAIDSLLTSVVADNMTKTKHKPNKELVGQGIGNSIAAVFGGIPGAGATIRTVVNINSGGKTKLSGMIAGLMLLVILLGLGPIASKIPAAVLAGILVTVGIGVMDYKGLKAIPSLPRDIKVVGIKLSSEVIIMIVVLLLSTFWNLVYAVGIGLVIASLMFMKKIGDLTAQQSKVTSLKEESWADEIGITKKLRDEIFIKHIKGPLFFGYTSDFQQLAKQIPNTAATIIIRMDRMQYIDQSGLYALEDSIIDLKKANKNVLFVDLQKQPRYMLERVNMIPKLISEEFVFENFKTCLQWVKDHKDA